MTRNALIIVDVQNDFVDGALATDENLEFTRRVSEWISVHKDAYDHVATTQDWHIDPGSHFDTWVVHCRAGEPGAEIRPEVLNALRGSDYSCFLKGQYSDGYSGFDGVLGSDGETSLAEWLRENNVSEVQIVGIATDHCVRATAVDAVGEGFDTTVLREYVNGVDPEESSRLLDEGFESQGVDVR